MTSHRNRVHEVLQSPGQPLDTDTRSTMAARFGQDFGDVRVHTDAAAAASAKALGARAYTVGRHIAFNADSYAPGTPTGKRLLAHELTHVVQQRSAQPRHDLAVSRPDDPAEVEARAVAGQTAAGGSASPMAQVADVMVHRAGPDDQDGGAADDTGQPKDAGLPGGVRPLDTGPSAGIQPRDATVTGGTGPRPTAAYDGPVLEQGPIGDVVLALPDWNFLPTKTFTKPVVSKSIGGDLFTTLLVPELGILAQIGGSAGLDAGINASYDGKLRDIRVGMSVPEAEQARERDRAWHPWLPLVDPLGLSLPRARTLDEAARMYPRFRALATIDVAGRVGGTVHLGAELWAKAGVAKLFDIVKIGAGLTAGSAVDAEIRFVDQISIYGADGKYHFRNTEAHALTVVLHFDLDAFFKGSLLGATWEKHWLLKAFDRNWTFGSDLHVDYDSAGAKTVDLSLVESAFNLVDTISALLKAAPGPSELTQANGPGGPGSPTGRPPTGRRRGDPIPMIWHKHPGLYTQPITLSGELYHFIGPEWLAVPPKGLDDVRNTAFNKYRRFAIPIGVDPDGRFYPKIGNVWQRIPSMRGGVKQDQFRKLLKAHGFDWGNDEADHVRDLQWGGLDEYENLWPLDRQHNLDANKILSQLVTYTDSAGNPETVPLSKTPLGLYFEIVGYQGNKGNP
ncbi:DUF4157 domain-containing protein [Kutzneria sp. NPDC052558]|uniref:DUF4157 domain-containing protein n=1 Tax=Kutzneria sp. NPDC052558 TaxID=3364121 RepID=UPI0037C93D91